MNTALATAKDMPTHRLTVRIPSTDYRQNELKIIKLNPEQAMKLAEGINDRTQDNIVITNPAIVPNPPAFYPKKWCYLEPIPDHEKVAARESYDRMIVQRAREAELKARLDKENAEITGWVESNPEEWSKINKQIEENMKSIYGISKGFSKALRGARARGIVAERLKLK